MREFISCLLDALKEGDLAGHLAAWWRVVTRQADPDDTADLSTNGWKGLARGEF